MVRKRKGHFYKKETQISLKDHHVAWTARFLMPFSWLGLDVYVPSITQVGEVFGTPVPISISLYTLGLGVGQLLFGPLSDSFGRKTIAIFGMLLFSLFSFLPLFTRNVDFFLTLRTLQGFAASAAFVCAGAMIRDRFSGHAAMREYGFLQASGNIIPVIGIPLGTLLLVQYGWRGAFVFLGFAGFFMSLYLMFRMSETMAHEKHLMAKNTTRNAANPFKNVPFLGFVICCSAVFSIVMTQVTLAPYEIMKRLGLSEWNYGIITSSNAIITGLSPIIFAKIAQHRGAIATLWLALLFLTTGAIGFIVSAEWLEVASFILFSILLSIGFGGFLAPASSLAMQPFSENKGKASAILGAGQLLGASFVAGLLSHFGLISRLSLGVTALLLTGICSLICLGLIRYFGVKHLQNPLGRADSQ